MDCAGERGSSIQGGGAVSSQTIHFNYYRLVPRSADYSSPPVAHFESGVRYAIFLKGREFDLHPAIPLYQMEVQLSPQSPSQPQPHRSPLSALVQERQFGGGEPPYPQAWGPDGAEIVIGYMRDFRDTFFGMSWISGGFHVNLTKLYEHQGSSEADWPIDCHCVACHQSKRARPASNRREGPAGCP